MDETSAITAGLLAKPRYVPVWYRYDKQGSEYNDRCLSDNTYYYFYNSEVALLKQQCQEIVSDVDSPCVLVEMGSGNSEKSRMFIDALLAKQSTLTYYPIDISHEFLQETANALSADYGDKLHVQPIPGEYNVGIEQIRHIKEKKIILWLGGGFQNQPYQLQVDRIHNLGNSMTNEDRLLIALDVTQNKEEVENAYLDPTGVSAPLYLNALWRMNRELGANINTDNFRLEARFTPSDRDDSVGGVVLVAVSLTHQTIDIPKLDLNFTIEEGEAITLHEGERLSCKYTEIQLRTLVQKAGQRTVSIWKDNHVALVYITAK